MRLSHSLRRLFSCLVGVGVLLVVSYTLYTELGGPAEEAVARSRLCMLCHALPEEPMLCLRSWQPGEPLTPQIAARLRQVHPLLSRGAEEPLTALLYRKQLPGLSRARSGAPGAALYAAKCAACHGKDGLGRPGEYPPLLGSEWITAEPGRLPEILTRGLQEPITVRGEAWDKTMRAPGLTTPEQVQQVIDYLRQTFSTAK